jgi:hypothetical protein
MTIESAADRAVFLTDFGEAVTFTPSGGSKRAIKGIFDHEYTAVDAGGGVPFAMQQPRLTCRTADVPGVADGDIFVVNSVSYVARIIMPDGTGMTEIMLEVE